MLDDGSGGVRQERGADARPLVSVNDVQVVHENETVHVADRWLVNPALD
jgi:hypothetical protein